MKSEKGITLISLIIYIITMVIVISVISNISSSMTTNLNEFDKESESAVSFSNFNMYFLSDIKSEGASIKEVSNNSVILKVGNENIQYQIQNNAMYRNKIKICDNIREFSIQHHSSENTITIYLKIGEYEKTTTYTTENIEIESLTQII